MSDVKQEPDKVLAAIAEALACLSKLLCYAHCGESYMERYTACTVAADGIRALSSVLDDMNV